MLTEPNKIDVIFWVENHPRCSMTIIVEVGEWEEPRALEYLQKKINYYQQQITSGAINKKEQRYEDRIFDTIDLYSKDRIPEKADSMLKSIGQELATLGISFSYEYLPENP